MITEENFLDFKCPYCGGAVSFPESAAGFAHECPNCMESLIVPGAGNEAGKKIPVPITTSRLILRRFDTSDWKDLMELAADEEFLQHVDGMAGGEEEQVLHWLESDCQIKLTTPNHPFRLAIQLQDGGKLIGCLTLWFTDQQQLQAIVNIVLHRNHQRKGFAVEAVDAILGFCFEGIKLHRVAARCDSRNTAACRLLDNVGMRREGEFVKDQRLMNGTWANTAWYAALDEEYREAAGKPEGSST
jgi:RimJ/RimL family protein N-acetyltransferase